MRKYRNAASDYEYGAMLGENLNFAASEAYKLLRFPMSRNAELSE